MNLIIKTFLERQNEWLAALWQHLELSLIALLLAMLIAIPLAIWVVRHPKISEILLQITSILQTIPSLALLGLLIPMVGIGTVPAVIALVIYALLPIFQNTYLGLANIDPSIEEAANAFGMSPARKLIKVELPMAMPQIVAGIRTALVLIIGTATLAALIGAGGLGTFIMLGIDRNNTSLLLIGAISSALLAVLLSLLIRWLEQVKPRYTVLALLGLSLVMFGNGLYHHYANRTETITIAGKLGSEPDILINMYQQLIENEDKQLKVELKPNFGKTTFLFSALKNDQIDIYPEFSGSVLETLVKGKRPQNLTPEQTFALAKKRLRQQAQMTYLPPMHYNNTYALAVKKSFQQKYHLEKISDLKAIQNLVQPGMTLEFIDREDGLKGLNQAYGLNLKAKSMEPALRYEAINQGRVNLIDAYATDSELRQYNLALLKDDRHFFPTYQGAPLMKQQFAKKHPQVVKALKRLDGKISNQEMQELNYEVNVKKESAAKVAHRYLVQHQLLKGAKS